MIKRIIDWFLQSHRWQHLIFGTLIGLGSNGWYIAAYIGVCVGGALEFKDWQWGGKPDWVDFLLTACGVILGYIIRVLFLKLIALWN
jgi:hypothetical protein